MLGGKRGYITKKKRRHNKLACRAHFVRAVIYYLPVCIHFINWWCVFAVGVAESVLADWWCFLFFFSCALIDVPVLACTINRLSLTGLIVDVFFFFLVFPLIGWTAVSFFCFKSFYMQQQQQYINNYS